MNISKIILGLLVSILCSTVVMSQVQRPDGKVALVNGVSQDSIHFFMMKVSLVNGKENVELIRSMIRPGRLKKNIDISLHHESKVAPFIFSIMDKKQKTIKSTEFPNPLIEHVEYVDDDGSLRKKEVTYEEKEFIIRVPYGRTNESLKFEKSTTDIKDRAKDGEGNELIGIIQIN